MDGATDLPISPGKSYSWDVPLLIPWTAASYDRGRLARNYWHLSAKLQFPGRFLAKTLSAEKHLFVFGAPQSPFAMNYRHTHTGVADGLGALQLSFISTLFTAGGYLRGAILLPSPSPKTKIHGITMTLIQTVTLQSRKRQRHFEKCPDDRLEFFSLKGEELQAAILHTGALCRARPASNQEEIELEWVARLPKDDQARASTLPGGDTHIRLSHHLELSLLYDVDADNPVRDQNGNVLHKRYRLTWPVVLISCALRAASWCLPEYSAYDTNPVPKRGRDIWEGRTEHETQDHCNCGDTLGESVHSAEDLADYSPNELLREGLMTQASNTASGSTARNGRTTSGSATRRHRSRTRAVTSNGVDGPGGTATERVGRGESRRRLGGGNGVDSSGTGTPTPASRSQSQTPHTPRSRSRAITPDRISIEYESGPDDALSSTDGDRSMSDDHDALEDEDEDLLMDKLERERQKREQLYDPSVG